jgi:hypothetical protein
MKKVVALLSLILLSGCATTITVPIDPTPLSKDKATLIIYQEDGCIFECELFLDRELIGKVIPEEPFKVAIEPGKHELHVVSPISKSPVNMIINRVTTKTFEKGKTQYMKVWLDYEMWITSLRIDPTDKVDSYETKSVKQKGMQYEP